MMSCNILSIFLSLNKSNTDKLQSEESCATNVCLTNLSTFPGASTARAVAADDWVENQQSAILQTFFSPDQRTFPWHMEEGAIISGSQNAKKLGKRKISKSNAEHGTCMYIQYALSFTVCRLTWNAQKAKKIPCPC